MDDEELAKPPIFRRGNVWWLKKRVPVDLARYPGEQVRKTLETEDYREAVRRYPQALAEVERGFARQRTELQRKGNVVGALAAGRLELLSRSEIEQLVAAWWEARRERQASALVRVENDEQREDVLASYAEDARDLVDPNREAGDTVRQVADQLLVQAGMAARPKKFGKIRTQSRTPTVDRDTAQYGYLCELVGRALRLEAPLAFDTLFHRRTAPQDRLFHPEGVPQGDAAREHRTVADLVAAYRADRSAEYGEKDTSKDYGHIFRALEQLLGAEKAVRAISKDDCRLLRETLRKLPANASKKYKGLSLQDAIAAGQADGAKLIAPTTLGTYMANLRAVLNWAKQEGWIDRNPVEGLVKKGKKSVKREGYTAEQLQRIFAELARFRDTEPAKFWVPAVALYTGARLGEICQLHVSDVVNEEGTICINLSEFDRTGRRVDDKGLKTPSSERYVPLHPHLIDAGFLTVVERRGNHLKLFDQRDPKAKEAFEHAFSKWFGRFMDRIGYPDPALTFHGFRHGFRNACRRADISQETAEALGGWASDYQSAKYGDRGMVPVLHRAVRKLRFGSFRLSDHVGS